jgi:two-component system, chemotaxis family, chemotaxis protein CheY
MPIDYSTPVLVVDDQYVMVTLVKQLLSNVGFEHVDHAFEGETALRMLEERSYQLVLSDLHMKPMDGLQLVRAIRQNEKLRNMAVVIMTIDSSIPAALATKKQGADAYLLKPFTPQQLRAKVIEVLSKSGS